MKQKGFESRVEGIHDNQATLAVSASVMLLNARQEYFMKRIRLTLFCLCVLFTAPLLHAQTYDWARGFGSASDNEFASSVVSVGDFVYFTGSFRGTVDFDPGPAVLNLTAQGSGDIYVAKFTTSGNLVWVRQVRGTSDERGMAVQVDADGNVYAAGMFAGTCDFDPGVGLSNLVDPTNKGQAFVWKLSKDGDYVWAAALGGDGTDWAYSLDLGPDGSVYTTGFYSQTGDFDPGTETFLMTSKGLQDIFISKLDPNGKFVWSKSVGGIGADWGLSLKAAKNGNVYVSGSFDESVDFDPSPSGTYFLKSHGLSDSYLVVLGNDGSFKWARSFGGVEADEAAALAVDNKSNVYLTGHFESTVDFDPGVDISELGPRGFGDSYVLKLDSLGNFVWVNSIQATNSASGLAIALDEFGYVYSAGSFGYSADFDPGFSSYILESQGAEDMYISKLDPQGKLVWALARGGRGTDIPNGLSVAKDGAVYVSGNFDDSVDFNPPLRADIVSHGGADFFCARFNQPAVDVPIDIDTLALSVSPNPARHILRVRGASQAATDILITNVLGQVVAKGAIRSLDHIELRIDDLEAGLYQVRVLSPGSVQTVPVVISR